MKETCPAVYDINLAIRESDSHKATIHHLLNGRGLTAYLFVKRYAIKDIPEDEQKAAEWLQELFRQKDKMQESFHEHGDFFSNSGVEPVEPTLCKPRASSLVNVIVWVLLTISFTLYYLAKLLLSGKIIFFSIGVGIIVGFYILMQKSISMSKISKASTYGSLSKNNSPLKEHPDRT